jgi:hypothetical protein
MTVVLFEQRRIRLALRDRRSPLRAATASKLLIFDADFATQNKRRSFEDLPLLWRV